jgi:hypothetical protein
MIQSVLEQAESALASRTGRRSFLARLGKALVALVGGPFVAASLSPGRAEAFHICGHIWTTGSCPHPYYPLTRIDAYGYPVHPTYGYPVDDQGNPYTSRSQRRRRVCDRVADEYPFTAPTVLEGTWSRCCNGRIRRIVDCCSRSRTRINGDASVQGYCFGGRRVFCITYRVTRVRC